MKNMKLILSAVLVMALILSCVPMMFGMAEAAPAKNYLTVEGNGVTLKFVSSRRCLIVAGDYQEYCHYRVEDSKVVFTPIDGEDIQMTEGEDASNLEYLLGNGTAITIAFTPALLSRIVNGQAMAAEKNDVPAPVESEAPAVSEAPVVSYAPSVTEIPY